MNLHSIDQQTSLLHRAFIQVRSISSSILAGLMGTLTAIVVMGIFRVTLGTLTPPELVGERILPLLPADTFVSLLIRFQPYPKTGPLSLSLLGMAVFGILLGPLYTWMLQTWHRHFTWKGIPAALLIVILLTIGLEALAALLFWPVLIVSVKGYSPDIARWQTLGSLLATFSSAVVVIAVCQYWLQSLATRLSKQPESKMTAEVLSDIGASRRQVVATAGALVVATILDGIFFRKILGEYFRISNLSYEGYSVPMKDAALPITPPSDFYIVSKNVIDPQIDITNWRLQIGGLVNQEREWSYADVRHFAFEERVVTLECISNPVGGRVISTAQWQGISLQSLLAMAGGVTDGAKYVVFTGTDSYQTSLPLKDLLEARAMVVWGMNGNPLPDRHGFPLRLIMPGRYGEQNPKWLTRIDVTNYEVKGFYQSQGWSAQQVETMSRIDYPSGIVSGAAPIVVGGIAFAGIRKIQQVEVSIDTGKTWQQAILQTPLSDQSWVLWQWRWQPIQAGKYTLMVRATDDTGVVQSRTQRGTVPNGATGWHSVNIEVTL